MRLKKVNKRNFIIFFFLLQLLLLSNQSFSQNSLVGDGFGGRQWYNPSNYGVGAYTAFTVCGLDSQLYGWGGNHFGELASTTILVSSDTPRAIPGMNHVKFFTTGYISGVIKSDNTAWVWGDSIYWNSGIPPLPTQVLTNVKYIDAGISHILFVKYDGTVWGMGSNRFGELGNGSTSAAPVTSPVQMIGINNAARAVAVNRSGFSFGFPTYDVANGQTVVLLTDGTIKTTGGGGSFQAANTTSPVTLNGLTDIVDIKGNWMGALALNSSGEVYSFGTSTNSTGVLGIGGNAGTPVNAYIPPTKIIFPGAAMPIVAISCNDDGYTALALDSAHHVYGWGNGYMGQLGNGSSDEQYSPVLVADSVIDICAGETFSYILKTDNSLWASGYSKWDYLVYDYGSIWMNLPNIIRHSWTRIEPTIAPMNLCQPKYFGSLPVKLLSFSCTAIGKTAMLAWVSAEEINCAKYEIEYSRDGVKFNKLISVFATGSGSKYSYNHIPTGSKAFYRLKIIDKDGDFSFSEIRVVSINEFSSCSITPNPARDVIYLKSENNNSIQTVQIINMQGVLLKTVTEIVNGKPINISDIPKGNYLLKVNFRSGEKSCLKLIKI